MKALRGAAEAIVLCLVISVMTAGLAQGAVTLEYKFTPGQSLNYEVTMEGTATTGMPAGMPPMQMGLRGTLDYLQRTEKVFSDGSAQIEISCPRMAMNVNMPGQAISMTWKNGNLSVSVNGQPESAEGMDFSSLPFLGVPLRVRMDKLGKVTGMLDLDALQGMLGNLDVSEMLKAGQNQLPGHPVSIGDTWTVDTRVPVPGTSQALTSRTTYTLLGIERMGGEQVAKMKMAASTQAAGLKMNLPGAGGAPQGMSMEELSQQAQGTVWFSVDRGQMLRSELTLRMHQVMSMQTPQGAQRITTDMNMKVDMRLK